MHPSRLERWIEMDGDIDGFWLYQADNWCIDYLLSSIVKNEQWFTLWTIGMGECRWPRLGNALSKSKCDTIVRKKSGQNGLVMVVEKSKGDRIVREKTEELAYIISTNLHFFTF